MARPWFSSRAALAALVLVSGLTLASCLELSVDVSFRTSTSGVVQVNALAYRLAQGLQLADGNDRIDFPSTQAQWQALADQVPGANLVSWTGADEDLGFRSQTVLSFANARALEGLFVVFKQKLTLLQDNQSKWTLTFVPQVPRVTAADADTRRLWTALWGQVAWKFSFTPPGQPATVRSVTLADLAGPQPPADWTLSWSP